MLLTYICIHKNNNDVLLYYIISYSEVILLFQQLRYYFKIMTVDCLSLSFIKQLSFSHQTLICPAFRWGGLGILVFTWITCLWIYCGINSDSKIAEVHLNCIKTLICKVKTVFSLCALFRAHLKMGHEICSYSPQTLSQQSPNVPVFRPSCLQSLASGSQWQFLSWCCSADGCCLMMLL